MAERTLITWLEKKTAGPNKTNAANTGKAAPIGDRGNTLDSCHTVRAEPIVSYRTDVRRKSFWNQAPLRRNFTGYTSRQQDRRDYLQLPSAPSLACVHPKKDGETDLYSLRDFKVACPTARPRLRPFSVTRQSGDADIQWKSSHDNHCRLTDLFDSYVTYYLLILAHLLLHNRINKVNVTSNLASRDCLSPFKGRHFLGRN